MSEVMEMIKETREDLEKAMRLQEYTNNGNTIYLDLTRDELLPEFSKFILRDRYMLPDEQSPQECFGRSATQFASDSEMAQRLYNYASNLWFMFSSPILANASTERGLPISCFGGDVEDSVTGILNHTEELSILSVKGGGTSGNWSNVRSEGVKTSKGNEAPGVIPFLKIADSSILAYKQGSTRRGSYAAYLDISHPDIEDFIIMRKPSGGDINRKCINLHHGINISDDFMDCVSFDRGWNLVDPCTSQVVRTVRARELWSKILETRVATGEPYIHFIDASNRALPQVMKDKGLKINNSNLCTEIILPTSPDRTFVCCLSSVNLEYFDEWSQVETFIPDIVCMLDNVLTYFIDNAPKEMHRAIYSAIQDRAIGLGAMGFHSFLQKKNIPFDSAMARSWNKNIFRHIKQKADWTSKELAKYLGEAPVMEGTGERFSHKIAVAPNASTSIICGVTSPSIEPLRANAFIQKTLSGSFLVKNKFLEQELSKIGMNNDEVWQSIIVNEGSVQHLDVPITIKEVFQTAIELDQRWIVEHGADRQEFIDQAQSINLFFPHNVHKQVCHKVHKMAWERGLKSLYYCRSVSMGRAEKIQESGHNPLDNPVKGMDNGSNEWSDSNESSCLGCEG